MSDISTIKNLKKQIEELQERMAALSTDVESLLSAEEKEKEEEMIELDVVFSPTLHAYQDDDIQLFDPDEDDPLKTDLALYETDRDVEK